MDIRKRSLSPRHVTGAMVLTVWLYSCGTGSGADPQRNAEAIAEKVEQQAERSEKKEGRHDLVPDTVTTKTNAAGEKVIEQVGEASFYGKGFQEKKAANGKKFNQQKRTAAHPTLPLGTVAKVTNLETGKSVAVRITDRGPYAKGRDLDLSKRAAKEIGLMKKEGEAPVKIEAVVPPQGKQAAAAPPDDAKATGRKRK